MSLPIAGGPKGPNRAPTHNALAHDKMMKLGLRVEDEAEDEKITAEALYELALEEGVDTSHLYASAAVTTDVQVEREHDVLFVACGGTCQLWGALDNIEHLVDLRQERVDAGKPAFDIQARSCLDRCEHAPVVMIHTPDGVATVTGANKQKLSEAVAEACAGETE